MVDGLVAAKRRKRSKPKLAFLQHCRGSLGRNAAVCAGIAIGDCEAASCGAALAVRQTFPFQIINASPRPSVENQVTVVVASMNHKAFPVAKTRLNIANTAMRFATVLG